MDNNAILIGSALGILLIGFLLGRIGRKGLNKQISGWMDKAKFFKAQSDHRYGDSVRLGNQLSQAQDTARRLHDQSGCTNDDTWEDHTSSQPHGLTPEVREANRIAEEKKRIRDAEIALMRENARKDEEARKKAQRDRSGGYTSTDGSWVTVAPMAVASSVSCDTGGGGDSSGGGCD